MNQPNETQISNPQELPFIDPYFNDLIKPNLKNMRGYFQIFSTKPTHVPKTLNESIGFWNDAGTIKLVVWKADTNGWYSFTGTLI